MELTPASLLPLVFAAGLSVLPPESKLSPAHHVFPPSAMSPLEHCQMFPEACAWADACYNASILLACGQDLSLVVGEDPTARLSREACSLEVIPPEDVFVLKFALDEARDVTFTVTSNPPGRGSLDLIWGCYTFTCPPDVERNAEGNSLSAHLDANTYTVLVRGLAGGAHDFSVTASNGTVPVRKLSWGLLTSRYASQ